MERSAPHAVAYTRHKPPCKQTDISYRRCKCPKWIQDVFPDGRPLRKTAKTRSWEKAEILCRKLEDESDPNKPQATPRTEIADAIKSFRDDEDARQLTEGTLQKNRYFFETQWKEWAAEALETFEKVNTLVIDKTGTLTEGKPRLTVVIPAAGFDELHWQQSVASLEKASEPPLAAAIIAGAKETEIPTGPRESLSGFLLLPHSSRAHFTADPGLAGPWVLHKTWYAIWTDEEVLQIRRSGLAAGLIPGPRDGLHGS
jgi:hypothetical protein